MSASEVYIDPTSGSNVTGDGSIGNPYAGLQYAYNNTVFNTTDGTRFNIKAGVSADVTGNAAYVFVDRTSAAPMTIQGYASAAGDGGVGKINTGSAAFYNTWRQYIHVADLDVTSTLSYNAPYYGVATGCIFRGNITAYTHARIIGCTVYGQITVDAFCVVSHNLVIRTGDRNIGCDGAYTVVANNIVIGGTNRSINTYATLIWVFQNSVLCAGGTGIHSQAGTNMWYNNLVQNASTAFSSDTLANSAYSFGNASHGHVTLTNMKPLYNGPFNDIALAGPVFVDAAGGDYTPSALAAAGGAGSSGAGDVWFRGAAKPKGGGGGIQVARGMSGGMRS